MSALPEDFMFRLTPEENKVLRSQIATSNRGRGGRRYLPFVFTEHGAIMAASVLNSPRAVEMSIFVVRAFVRLNEMLASNREVAAKVMELDRRLKTQDTAIYDIVAAIRRLMKPSARRIPRSVFVPEPWRGSLRSQIATSDYLGSITFSPLIWAK